MKDETFLDLRRFLDRLRSNGDLRVVDAPVDPRLEIAEIHRRVIAAGGPALLFTHPEGSKMPVVTNLFGTAGRARTRVRQPPFRPGPFSREAGRGRTAAVGLHAVGPSPLARGRVETRDPGCRRRSGSRRGFDRGRSRGPAGAHLVAGGRRPVCHSAPGGHPPPRNRRPESRDVPAPDPRRAAYGDALADRQGGGIPLFGGRGEGRGSPDDRVSRRSSGAHPRRRRAAAGKRARVDAGVADRRRQDRPVQGPGRTFAHRQRRDRTLRSSARRGPAA